MWAGLNHRSDGFVQASFPHDWQFAIDRYNARTAESLKAVIDICRKDLVLGQALGKQLKVFTPTLYALALGNEPVSYEDILATWRAVSEDRDDMVRRGGEDEARP